MQANLFRLEINAMSNKNANLLEEFSQVQKLLSKYQLWYCRKFGPSGDPHRGQGRVLAILNLQREISQKELSFLLDMRNQSLGELLGKLEKNGAITREPSEEDRRSMNIKLTEAGANLIKQGRKKPDEVSMIFDCLSVEDQTKLHEMLDCLSGELFKLLSNDEDSANKKAKEKSSIHHRKIESDTSFQRTSTDDERRDSKPHRETHHDKQKEGSLK